MHYAIEFHAHHAAALRFGKRQRLPQGHLLQITHGMALLRLGSHEQLLSPGALFWLPADCLATFIPLRDCRWQELLLSLRHPQPSQSGWLHATPLLKALLDALTDWTREPEWQGAYGDRLRVLADELQQHELSTQPPYSALQQEWQALRQGVAPQEVSEELAALAAQWRLIRADRLLKGGNPLTQVVAQLGYGDESAWQDELNFWCTC